MRKLIAGLVPLAVIGCGTKTATVQAPIVPPLNPPAVSTAMQSSDSEAGSSADAHTASAPLSSVTNGRFTDTSGKTSYLPMAEGNTWIYDGDIEVRKGTGEPGGETVELIFKLTDVKHNGDKTQATLTVWQGDQVVDRSIWQEAPDGIYQLSSGRDNIHFDKPEPVMLFPIKGQEVLNWSNSGMMPDAHRGSQSGRTVVSTAAQIDTAISTVQGVESATTQHFKSSVGSGDATTSTWFEPGVGIVRLVQSTTEGDTSTKSTLRLKSWTLQH